MIKLAKSAAHLDRVLRSVLAFIYIDIKKLPTIDY